MYEKVDEELLKVEGIDRLIMLVGEPLSNLMHQILDEYHQFLKLYYNWKSIKYIEIDYPEQKIIRIRN